MIPTALISRSAAAQPEAARQSAGIRRLHREELPVGTLALSRFLIGKLVVRETREGRMSGRIVETEAYPPGDAASHHFRGPTPRIRPMYLARGHAYIFFNYGNHFMLNVVSEPEGVAGAILIRALEPVEGVEWMQENRGTTRLLDLTRGPGRLASALEIDGRHHGIDLLTSKNLWLGVSESAEAGRKARRVRKTVRIGISRAADRMFRFYEYGNPFVSGPKRLLASASRTRRSV
jgi:DNA-3-methyladenine glycosylase